VYFAKVMDVQIDRMVKSGIPINKAQKVLIAKQTSIDIIKHASNYNRVSSADRLINMPYLNIHNRRVKLLGILYRKSCSTNY
jgi:hypothetical protein